MRWGCSLSQHLFLGDGHQAAASDARRTLLGKPDQGLNTFIFYLSDFETLSARAFASRAKIHQRDY